MAKPPKWEVVLKADATDVSSMDWSRLQMLVKKALPNLTQAILDLKKPVFRQTSYHGHFGRKEFSWEKIDKVNALLKAVKALG